MSQGPEISFDHPWPSYILGKLHHCLHEKAIVGNNPRAILELMFPHHTSNPSPREADDFPKKWGLPGNWTFCSPHWRVSYDNTSSFFLSGSSFNTVHRGTSLGASSNTDEPLSSSSGFHLQSLVPITQGHLGRWGSHRGVSQLYQAGICKHSPIMYSFINT